MCIRDRSKRYSCGSSLGRGGLQELDPAYHQMCIRDRGKHEMAAYETEIGLVLSDIRSAIRHLPGWMKEKKVPTPLHLFPGKSRIRKEPYGQVLIMGPFNYPFQLLMEPLIGAMAAGNCSVVKPSELAPHSMKIVKKIIEETFQREYICCVEGGLEENQALLNQQFDYIFFTGSVRVGRIVMEAVSYTHLDVYKRQLWYHPRVVSLS